MLHLKNFFASEANFSTFSLKRQHVSGRNNAPWLQTWTPTMLALLAVAPRSKSEFFFLGYKCLVSIHDSIHHYDVDKSHTLHATPSHT